MAKIMNGNRVVTNEVRLSYANVWKPKSINGSDEKYSVSLIIPKFAKDNRGWRIESIIDISHWYRKNICVCVCYA